MIVERWMVSGKRLDNGERVYGHLFSYQDGQCLILEAGTVDIDFVIDPATIAPVGVAPKFIPNITMPESILCPNCGHDLMGGIEVDAEHDPPYCWECGMALLWEDENENHNQPPNPAGV